MKRQFIGGKSAPFARLFSLTCALILLGLPMYAAAQEEVEIVIYQSDQELFERFFEAFKEKTGIDAVPVWYTGNQQSKWEQTITKIAGGISPDIVTATSTEFVQYAAAGLIQPLDSYIARENVSLDGVVPAFLDALKWKGMQYQMPYGASGMTLVVNDDMFNEAGIALPPREWGDSNWTWETFLADARKLTVKRSDGTVTQWGLSGFLWWLDIPYNWGGRYINESLDTFTGTDENVVASWQAAQDLPWVYEVAPKPGQPGASLFEGGAAMGNVGTWNQTNLVASELSLRYAPWFQVGDNRPVGVMYPVGLALLASAPNKDNAWEVIKFATLDPRGDYLWSRAAGAVPGVFAAHEQWLADLESGRDINPQSLIQQAAEHAAIINIRKATNFNQIEDILDETYDQVLANEKDPRQAMEGIASQVQTLISQGNQ